MKKLVLSFLLMGTAFANTVFASGLAIPEQGAAAMGLSAAVTARSEDLSAIFYNAAGISYVEKDEVLLGLTPIMPSHSFEGSTTDADAEQNIYLPPQLFAAHRVNDQVVLGLGVYTPFGLGTDWGETWNGRYTSTYAEIQAVYVTPTVAYQPTEWLSVGAGFSYIYSTAVIEKMIDAGLALYSSTGNASMVANPKYDSKFSLDGTGSGINWNLGIQVRPAEKIQLGLAYRSATDLDYDGDAKFTHSDSLSSALQAALLTLMPLSQDGATTLHLPSTLNAGILYDITSDWDASFDVDFTQWSTYDKLVIELENGTSTQLKNWDDTFCFRLGTAYDLDEGTVLRGGLMYDQNPVPDGTFDAQLPDGDRIGVSFGFGKQLGRIRLDCSYLFLTFADRDKDNTVGYTDSNKDGAISTAEQTTENTLAGGSYPVGTGTYSSHVNLVSVSATMKF